MKKIFMFLAAMAMTFMAAAQTVESSKLFENTYVTVLGGATTSKAFGTTATPFLWDGAKDVFKGVRPLAGLEFGKDFTPVVGFGVEGLAFFGTNGSCTFVDQSAVLLNGKLNFSNWFGGYKGQPRRVEVVGVAGLGWGHDYGDVIVSPNYVVYNTGAELNVNLGKQREWQISVRPTVLWNNYDNLPLPKWSTDARANLQVGVVYKFGSKSKKSHNFVLCPYSVRQSDYDDLLAKYNALAGREPEVKEVVKTVTDTVYVNKTVEVEVPNSSSVYFNIGEYTLSDREVSHLDYFANGIEGRDVEIKVTGSADTATGSEARNKFLAEKRAETVKNYLVEKHGFNADKIKTEVVLDIFGNTSVSRVAVVD